MPRRCNDNSSEDEPPKKRCNSSLTTSSFVMKHGEFLTDITGKQWKLGKAVGVGGFGEIYLASDNLSKEVKPDSKYVAKVENHKNGPLFVEMNCYIRIAKQELIKEWKQKKKISSLGMPHYVASGSHIHKGERYRFLILPKFEKDLEKILEEKKILNLKTVLTISLQILDVLEYIHSTGYIHSDIKASNILLTNQKKEKTLTPSRNKYIFRTQTRACRQLRTPRLDRSSRNLRPQSHFKYIDDIPNFENLININSESNGDVEKTQCGKDQAYLLDYGLASKFLTSSGEHKPFCVDERKAHAGTILFCSRDAHKGVPSRRSDLESLAYNLIFWLTGNLPWSGGLDNPEIVHKQKQRAMTDIEYFLKSCFCDYPAFLKEYLKYLQALQFQEKPDYNYCKEIFKQCIKRNGYKDDSRFDFNNLSMPKRRKTNKRFSENMKIRTFICRFSRPPLQSNIPVKKLLRKKEKSKVHTKRNWFKDVADPEVILKQAREKKSSENEANFVSNIADLNINKLNPTYAMIEVYNKCRDRIDASPSYKGDCFVENVNGYTPAMMTVLENMKRRKDFEREQLAVNLTNTRNGRKRRKKYESPTKSPPQTRTTKSATAIKKDNCQTRKTKAIPLRRTYSLRG